MKSIVRILTIAATILLALGCQEDELQLEGAGISKASWSENVIADEDGQMLSLTFTAEC